MLASRGGSRAQEPLHQRHELAAGKASQAAGRRRRLPKPPHPVPASLPAASFFLLLPFIFCRVRLRGQLRQRRQLRRRVRYVRQGVLWQAVVACGGHLLPKGNVREASSKETPRSYNHLRCLQFKGTPPGGRLQKEGLACAALPRQHAGLPEQRT